MARNIRSGNAQVGIQADTITGGVTVTMFGSGGNRNSGGGKGHGLDIDALIADAKASGGTVNVVSGNDVIGVQAAHIYDDED